jgi:DNA-binding NarL/FixJ family response regulator
VSEWPAGIIKIALIEPEASGVARIKGLVRAGGIPAEVADAMSAETPRLESAEIILLGLHGFGEPERTAIARLHAGFPAAPLIVLLSPGAASQVGEAVRLGAQYAILSDELTPAKLSSLVRYYADYARERPDAATHTA